MTPDELDLWIAEVKESIAGGRDEQDILVTFKFMRALLNRLDIVTAERDRLAAAIDASNNLLEDIF